MPMASKSKPSLCRQAQFGFSQEVPAESQSSERISEPLAVEFRTLDIQTDSRTEYLCQHKRQMSVDSGDVYLILLAFYSPFEDNRIFSDNSDKFFFNTLNAYSQIKSHKQKTTDNGNTW
jgi:hypothetical protein